LECYNYKTPQILVSGSSCLKMLLDRGWTTARWLLRLPVPYRWVWSQVSLQLTQFSFPENFVRIFSFGVSLAILRPRHNKAWAFWLHHHFLHLCMKTAWRRMGPEIKPPLRPQLLPLFLLLPEKITVSHC